MAGPLPETELINSCSNDPEAKGKQEIMTAEAIHRIASGLELLTQIDHGFSVGEILFHSGTEFIRAKSDAEATIGRFLVIEAIDSDNCWISSTGRGLTIDDANFANQVESGKYYMTSRETAGAFLATDATGVEDYMIRNPIFTIRKKEGNVCTIDMLPWRADIGHFSMNYRLQFSAGPHGTVSGDLDQTVLAGGDGTTVTATPDSGYEFYRWSDGNVENPRHNLNVQASTIAEAIFRPPQVYLTYIAGQNGSIIGDPNQMLDKGDDGSSVTADPDPHYHFTHWDDGVIDAVRQDTNVYADITTKALFEINKYSVIYNVDTHGTISGASNQTVNYGTNANPVEAIPDTGYHFVQWDDGIIDNPRTDTNVTQDINVTAQFAINTYTLDYTAGEHGTVSGTLHQPDITYGSDGSEVTAIPDTGYHFVQWSDGIIDNPRTDINVTADVDVTAQFTNIKHTLVYHTNVNGSLSGALSQEVNEGDDGSPVSATPNTGYHFISWSDGIIDNPRQDVNVMADIEVTAYYEEDTFNVTYAASDNGTISGNTNQTVNYGDNATEVTAVPDTGYHFVQWSDGSTDNPRQDLNVTNDIDVTAQFAINEYTVNYIAGTNGSISGTTPQVVSHGADTSSVTAVANQNYIFSKWNDGITDNPRIDTNVVEDITVGAVFVRAEYNVDYAADANGVVTGDLHQVVDYGNDATEVTAVPNTGYHFVQWDDGITDNPRQDLDVTYDVEATAQFAINEYTVQYNADAHSGINGTTTQIVQHGSDSSAVTVVADTGYHFTQWDDGITDNPRVDTNVTADIDVTAETEINTYNLNYAAGTNGTVTGNLAQQVEYDNDGTEVTAIADTGYHFVQWSDGVTTASRTDTHVNSDIDVTAQFAINTYTVTYLADPNGSISGTTPQQVDYGNDSSSVTAVPDTGYHFTDWDDGITDNPRQDTNVIEDITATAQFAINQYTFTYTAGSNGSITGTSPQVVNYGDDGTEVTAVADTGYHFVQWSDGVTTASRTDTNATADIDVTAQFVAD